jgi:hypothetical protein
VRHYIGMDLRSNCAVAWSREEPVAEHIWKGFSTSSG